MNPAEKKNLVQFRDHNGKVLATLQDPNTWNSANVTLSKEDDKRRYMNDWRSIQAEGGVKRGGGISSSEGEWEYILEPLNYYLAPLECYLGPLHC